MTDLVKATVSDDVDMRVVAVVGDEGSLFVIGSRIDTAGTNSVKQMVGDYITIDELPEVALRAHWAFGPNTSGQWIKVLWSQFGIYVKSKSDWAPFVRLEVDPNKDEWAASHLNITGESTLLGYIWGRAGKPRRRLQALHFPVGGFRFRPCLEDFLEFVIDEGLVPGRTGWNEALNATRDEYRLKQFRSLVTKYPNEARAVLDDLETT